MVIAIFGESCTGKSTLANRLGGALDAKVYLGKDFLRLAKSESEAERKFETLLRDACSAEEYVIFVTSEKTHLSLLPERCFRVLMRADIALIKQRFAERMGCELPEPVSNMLDRKHGRFDAEPHDICIVSGEVDAEDAAREILERLGK